MFILWNTIIMFFYFEYYSLLWEKYLKLLKFWLKIIDSNMQSQIMIFLSDHYILWSTINDPGKNDKRDR